MAAPLFPTYRVSARELRAGDAILVAHEPALIMDPPRTFCGYIDVEIERVDGVSGRYHLTPELPVVLLSREN